MVRPDRVEQAAHSPRLAGIAVGVFGVFLFGCAGIYLAQPSASTAATPVHPPDPLAARRQPPPAPELEPDPATASEIRPASFGPGVEAIELYRSGDLSGAIAGLETVVDEHPEDAEARTSLGQALVNLGRVGEAIPHLQGAVALNPGRLAYRVNLARALGLLQRWDEAIASYRAAQEIFADDDDITAELARALHNSGQTAAPQGH